MTVNIDKVAVIGAGVMGHGIAQTAAMAGLQVYLYDREEAFLNKAMEKIEQSLAKLLEKKKISQEVYETSKQLLRPTSDLSTAVRDVQFAFEAVPEVLSVKQDVFKQLEELTDKDTILATNTSNMSIGKIADKLKHPERVVGVHFFNPVVLMDLVEVIKGEKTDESVMQTAYQLCLRLKKRPVRVEKDTPGFIVNRVNAPVRVFLGAVVDEGHATCEEIDAVMKSAGDPMGPFELADYVGLDTVYYSAIYRGETLHPDYAPFKKLTEKVKAGHLGRKTGQGFYDWSQGRPKIDLSRKTDRVTPDDILFIKLNEAMKLLEEGVATAEDIDLAMVLGTGDRVGPFTACKDKDKEVIISRLTEIAELYKKEVLRPTARLREYGVSLDGNGGIG